MKQFGFSATLKFPVRVLRFVVVKIPGRLRNGLAKGLARLVVQRLSFKGFHRLWS